MDEDLKTTKQKVYRKEESKSDIALKNAAANAALKAAIEANTELSQREADKTYILEKKKHMLKRCKEDKPVKFVGQKLYAQYFGEIYSYMFNGIPVVVKFDGSTQEFPEFIYKNIMKRLNAVSENSTPKNITEDRTK